MTSRGLAVIPVLAIALLSGASAWAQQEITVGPWTAQIGTDGLHGLAYEGETSFGGEF